MTKKEKLYKFDPDWLDQLTPKQAQLIRELIKEYQATIHQQARLEREKWFKWLNHYAMGQPAMNIINNHSQLSQVFIIPIKDLKEALR